MLAKLVNDDAGTLGKRGAFAFFVGTPPGAKLAPTEVGRYPSMSASAGRRGRGCTDLRPFLRRVSVQSQRMDLAHQVTQGGVDLLVTLDAVEPVEQLADHHRLEVGLQPTTVHVAFIQHVQVLGVQCAQRRFDTMLHAHSGSAYFVLAGAAFGSSWAVMSSSSLLTTGTALSSLA